MCNWDTIVRLYTVQKHECAHHTNFLFVWFFFLYLSFSSILFLLLFFSWVLNSENRYEEKKLCGRYTWARARLVSNYTRFWHLLCDRTQQKNQKKKKIEKKSHNFQIDCHRLRRKIYVLEYIKENIYIGTEPNRIEQSRAERSDRKREREMLYLFDRITITLIAMQLDDVQMKNSPHKDPLKKWTQIPSSYSSQQHNTQHWH